MPIFPYFADTRADGADLRVIAADDKTPLKFHIEKFDAQAQIALVWVRLPQITGGMNADKFYLYYGNPKGTAAADSAGTYDSNQSLVYHFAAAAPAAQDSTGFKIEPQNVTATYEAASLIGGGLRFAGTSAFTAPAAPALQLVPAQGYTVSAWLRADGAQQKATVAAVHDAGKELSLGIDGEQAFAVWRDGGREVRVVQPGGSAPGEWHHVALRAANGQLSLLVDGVQVAQQQVALQPMDGALTVGGAAAGGGFYRGEMDELQVANTGRSDAWLRAAATSQGMVAPLLVYGGDAQKDDGKQSQSYFASTLRNVTVDGWVIIGALAVMFVFSVLIMVYKLQFLNRVAGGNARFLAEYSRMREDLTSLERSEGGADNRDAMSTENKAFGISTLWILYHQGMRETMKRFQGQAAGARIA